MRSPQVAYNLTEIIPLGTYTMVQSAVGGMGRFAFVSNRFLELTGLDRETVTADPLSFFARIHPDDYWEWMRKSSDMFEHKTPFCSDGRIIVHGQTRWIRAETNPRSLPDGSVVWEGVLSDITAQKKAESMVADGDAALRTMLDTLPYAVGICMVGESHRDPTANIVFVNKSFISLLGYTCDDIPTVKTWADRAYPDENYRKEVFDWWDAAVRRLAGGVSGCETHESRVSTKQGTKRDILVSAAPLQDKLIVTFKDLTEERESERRKARVQADQQRILANLSPRRREIFQMIGRGMRTEKIAEALQISIATAKAHRKQIAKKLGISAREMNHEAALCWQNQQNSYPDPSYQA